MLFNSTIFLFVFLPVTYLVFWALPTARARYVWLAVTGYVFYSYWNPWFYPLDAVLHGRELQRRTRDAAMG